MGRTRLDTAIRFEPEERDRLRKILRAVPGVIDLSEEEAVTLAWFLGELKKE